MSIAAHTPLPALLLAVVAALVVSGCSVQLDLNGDTTRRTEHELIPGSGVTALDLTTENGAIEVVAGAGDDIDLRVMLEESDEGDADYSVTTTGDTVEIAGECDGGWFEKCQVGFVVSVPEGVDVRVRTSNGRIMLDGIDGDVDAETDNGAIDGRAIRSASVDADTDNGRVELIFDEAPDSVEAVTDNGAISIRVPEDAGSYDVSADSDNGSVDVDVRTDPSADRVIVAESDNGSVDVGYRAS